MKTKLKKELTQDAQHYFNKFIRLRDRELDCISCGRDANRWNAGHFKSVGSSPNLRFHEDNCHKQCARPCNHDLSGNLVEYRKNLIDKIGIDKVEALEADKEPRKYTKDELIEIKKKYMKLCREMKD